MCLPSAPKQQAFSVAAPAAPTALPAAPTPQDPKVSAARKRDRAASSLAQGRAGTILTSPLGLSSTAGGARATLLA